MGETRHPAKGSWVVFEGAPSVASIDSTLAFGESINRPIVWPVTLRVFYIRDGVMRSRDVEIDEQLEVVVRDLDEEPLDGRRGRSPEAVTPDGRAEAS